MFVIDSSSLVNAWDNYPVDKFPSFWNWLGSELSSGHVLIPVVVEQEVKFKFPDIYDYMTSLSYSPVPVDVSIVSYSMILKKVIGVEEDQYGPKGVDENDIFVIASAHCKDMILISDEGVQFTVPKNLANCKIPMVCQLAEENIECIKLIDFINRSSLSI